jgi:hypothetical protein
MCDYMDTGNEEQNTNKYLEKYGETIDEFKNMIKDDNCFYTWNMIFSSKFLLRNVFNLLINRDIESNDDFINFVRHLNDDNNFVNQMIYFRNILRNLTCSLSQNSETKQKAFNVRNKYMFASNKVKFLKQHTTNKELIEKVTFYAFFDSLTNPNQPGKLIFDCSFYHLYNPLLISCVICELILKYNEYQSLNSYQDVHYSNNKKRRT